jgi:hypothetical protein
MVVISIQYRHIVGLRELLLFRLTLPVSHRVKLRLNQLGACKVPDTAM